MKSIKIIFLLFACSSLHISLSAQQEIVDSLKSALPRANPLDRANALSTLCYYQTYLNMDEAVGYCEEALTAARALEDSNVLQSTYNDLSIHYMMRGEWSVALKYNMKAYTIRKQNNKPEDMISSLSKIGLCYSKMQSFEKAIEHLMEAAKVMEENDLVETNYLIYDNIGVAFIDAKKPARALEYHNKALLVVDDLEDQKDRIPLMLNIGAAYRNLQDYEKAIDIYLNAVEIMDTGEISRNFGVANTNLGAIFVQLGEFEKGVKHARVAANVHSQIGNIDGFILAINNMGMAFVRMDQLDSAEKYLTTSLEISKEQNSHKRIMEAYQGLGDYYSAKGDYKMAFATKLQEEAMKDSVFNAESNKIVEALREQYETERKERELAENKIALADEEIKNHEKSQQLLMALGGLAFVIVLGSFIYIGQRNKAARLKRETDLNLQLAEAETLNQVQGEKLRIARDLHDNIGSQLTFIVSSLDNLAYVKSEQKEEKAKEVGVFARQAMTELRQTVWAMKSGKIHFTELSSKIAELVNRLKTGSDGTELHFTAGEGEEEFDSEIAINIFRCVQEALNNALKYAEASKIEISIQMQEGLEVSISDNGKGLSADELEKGSGLRNMKARMSENGGSVDFSKSTDGLSVILKQPLKNTA